ncbi:hypothetical protein [Microcoleus sp. B4-C1]|uniref:hypothetical protein n=1 Tax=Microcoleus sp. B4-C1 TaxID=2818660 RepID=UPI002FCED7C6
MIATTKASVNTDSTLFSVRLQTEVNEFTKNYLRIEAIRRNVTMGQLLDELIKQFCNEGVSEDVSKTNS